MEPFVEESRDINRISDKIKRDGICVIKNYIDREKLKKIDEEFENILSSNIGNRKIFGKNKFIYDREVNKFKKFDTVYNLFTNNFINNISNKILGHSKYHEICIHKDFQNKSTNNVYPHFDYDRYLKFYLCVNDMNLENGCFKILPGKNDLVKEKRKKDKRKNIFTPGHKFYNGTEIKMEEMIPVIANGGDLIIFDTNCIHCGGDRFVDGKDRKVIRLHLAY